MGTIIAQFKKEVRVESKKKAPFWSEGVVLWSQKQNEVPPPEKKGEKGVKREGKGNADDLCCGVWSKADSNAGRETIKVYTEISRKKWMKILFLL